MTTDEPIYIYERTGFSFKVYRNRIEIVDKSAFGAVFTGGKKETILLRAVTNVTIEGLTKKLKVTTNDEKKHEFNLGVKSEEAKQAIVSVL